jgi:hypothetical protein
METKAMNSSELKFNIDTWKRELRFHFDEMDTFQEKLDEITARQDLGIVALKKLDTLQNRILIEKESISKLKHRCRNVLTNFNRATYENSLNGSLFNDRSELRDDMRNYIQLHYKLKEGIIDFVLENS